MTLLPLARVSITKMILLAESSDVCDQRYVFEIHLASRRRECVDANVCRLHRQRGECATTMQPMFEAVVKGGVYEFRREAAVSR